MDNYIGEVRLFAGNFAPLGWALCDGSIRSISADETLFTLIGTTYGGNGVTTFGLPDLRGRAPIHQGTLGGDTYVIGQIGGTENVTLTAGGIPAHTHALAVTQQLGKGQDPTNCILATAKSDCQFYVEGSATVALNVGHINATGAGVPHSNMQPYLAATYIIATSGLWPSQG